MDGVEEELRILVVDLNRSENGARQAPMENMNGDYKISNPLAGSNFDSHYSKFSNVGYFDVSSTKPKLSSASGSSHDTYE